MRASLFLIPLLLSSAACSDERQYGAGASGAEAVAADTASAEADSRPVARAAAKAGGARSVEEETPLYIFSYSYPAQAGAIAPLARRLDERLDEGRRTLVSEAEAARADAAAEGYPYHAHSATTEWEAVADLPRWLSLSADVATYSGGAHGNRHFESLLWDKEAERLREPLDLFRSPGAFGRAIAPRYCATLDRLRAERRGEPVAAEADGMFNACPDISELTILLGSSDGRRFDRIGLLADPYVAGPWAEGPYEVTLAIDAQVIDAVRDEFAADFAIGR